MHRRSSKDQRRRADIPADAEIGGAYLPSVAQALLLAWLILLLLNPLLRRLGVLQRVWYEALFQGALYCVICAGLILWMGETSR